ncbi:TPA: adenylyl-sulfate kinase [Aeromonas dhakensis]|uniref:Adenylyl-sulfate kinase n=1 Tax=Aeromonas schubertii TaxID=652 RepID=A0ABS7VGH8_9GAMM|nr:MULTISPECIES: adenylyl-sulfate kinase [Aeromonas]ASX09829.1 adenylyl-sulfate kinase [Aeromonas dhakensis]MBZ6068038.1 adenylyl-sulfate kinase [Aeromonas schubertii]HDX8372406.1 adenylyl-sulfate kinase [Aeromonas dhakensis]
MVIWIVGLSGAGKTTIGHALYENLKIDQKNLVFVDGDEIRALFCHDQIADAYSIAGRRINAERIQSLCRWLDGQGIDVVCCNLAMFPDIRNSNRHLFSDYREIFVDVPLSALMQRDDKGLYQAALCGRLHNVVGVDIEYCHPVAPDLVIHNSFDASLLPEYISRIQQVCGRGL